MVIRRKLEDINTAQDAVIVTSYGGRRVDARTNCAARHPFSKKRRQLCDRIRDCTNEYGALKAINPVWYEAAISACNTEEYFENIDDFLCSEIGGDVLFNSGFERCGFNPEDTILGQQQQQDQVRADEINKNQFLIAGILGLVFVFIVILIVNK